MFTLMRFFAFLLITSFNLHSYTQSITKVDSLMDLSQKVEEPNKRVLRICRYAQETIEDHDLNVSLALADSALKLAQKHNDSKGVKTAYLTLGGIHYYRGRFDDAIVAFYDAIKFVPDSLRGERAHILGNIAVIYKKQNNLKKAMEIQSDVLQVFKERNDSMAISITYTNIGEIFRLQNEYENALKSYKKSMKIKQLIKHESGLAVVYSNMGLCYGEMSDFVKAKKYLDKAYRIEQKIGNKVRLTETILDIANYHQLTNDFEKSNELAFQALSTALELNLKETTANLYFIIAKNYASLKDYKSAFSYSQKYFTLKESIINEGLNDKIAELEVKYETAQKEQKIEKQRLELFAKQTELAKNKLQRNGAFIGIFFLIVISFFSYKAYRQNKHINILLSGQNLLIQNKNKELSQINENVSKELEKMQLTIDRKEEVLKNVFEKKRNLKLPDSLLNLSKREMEVLAYLALGWSDQEISNHLFISKSTTKTHLRRIYSKLLVSGRAEAVSIAHRYGIIGD